MNADAFAPYTLAADLLELGRIFARFFDGLSADDWQRPTEAGGRGWTLREAVAHLDAVAWAYQQCIGAALEGRPTHLRGISRREELAAWNAHGIAERADEPTERVCTSFLAALGDSARVAAQLGDDELAARTATPVFNGAVSVATLLGGQLAHPGLVHAAQVANGANVPPLWHHYRPALMHRQISRLFRITGAAYWPERGGDLRASVAFQVAGEGGGQWYIAIRPGEALGLVGAPPRASLRLSFASADLFCRAVTQQAGLGGALLRGRLRVRGNLALAARFGSLFLPT